MKENSKLEQLNKLICDKLQLSTDSKKAVTPKKMKSLFSYMQSISTSNKVPASLSDILNMENDDENADEKFLDFANRFKPTDLKQPDIENKISKKENDIKNVEKSINNCQTNISSLNSQISSLTSPNEANYQKTDKESGKPVTDRDAFRLAMSEYENQKARLELQIKREEANIVSLEANLTSQQAELSALQNEKIQSAIENKLSENKPQKQNLSKKVNFLGNITNIKAADEECVIDPIGIESSDGVKYDFIKDDGDFDEAADFLGASNGVDELISLDENGDGKVTGEELAKGNIRVVRTNPDTNEQEIMTIEEIEAEMGGNISIDVSNIDKNTKEDSTFDVNLENAIDPEYEETAVTYKGYSKFEEETEINKQYDYSIDDEGNENHKLDTAIEIEQFLRLDENGNLPENASDVEKEVYQCYKNGDFTSVQKYKEALDTINLFADNEKFNELFSKEYGYNSPFEALENLGVEMGADVINKIKNAVLSHDNNNMQINAVNDCLIQLGLIPDSTVMKDFEQEASLSYNDYLTKQDLQNILTKSNLKLEPEAKYDEQGFITELYLTDSKGNVHQYTFGKDQKIETANVSSKDGEMLSGTIYNEDGSFTKYSYDKDGNIVEETSEKLILTMLANNSIDIADDITAADSPLVKCFKDAKTNKDALDTLIKYCGGDVETAKTIFCAVYDIDKENLNDKFLSENNNYAGDPSSIADKLYDYKNGHYYISQKVLDGFSTLDKVQKTEETPYADESGNIVNSNSDNTVLSGREYYINANGQLCTNEFTQNITADENGKIGVIYTYNYTNLQTGEKTTDIVRPETGITKDGKKYDFVIIRDAKECPNADVITEDGKAIIYADAQEFIERMVVEKNYTTDRGLTAEEIRKKYASLELTDEELYKNILAFRAELNSQGDIDKLRNTIGGFIGRLNDDDIKEEITVRAKLPEILNKVEAGEDVSEICEKEFERRLGKADSVQDLYECLSNYYDQEKALEILNKYINSDEVFEKFKNYLGIHQYNNADHITEVNNIDKFEFSVDKDGKVVLNAHTMVNFENSALSSKVLTDGFSEFNQNNPVKQDMIDKLGVTGLRKPTEQEDVYNAVYRFWTNGGDLDPKNIEEYTKANYAYSTYNMAIAAAYEKEQALAQFDNPDEAFQYLLEINDNNTEKAVQEFNKYFENAIANVEPELRCLDGYGTLTSLKAYITEDGSVSYNYTVEPDEYTDEYSLKEMQKKAENNEPPYEFTYNPDDNSGVTVNMRLSGALLNLVNAAADKKIMQKDAYTAFLNGENPFNSSNSDTVKSNKDANEYATSLVYDSQIQKQRIQNAAKDYAQYIFNDEERINEFLTKLKNKNNRNEAEEKLLNEFTQDNLEAFLQTPEAFDYSAEYLTHDYKTSYDNLFGHDALSEMIDSYVTDMDTYAANISKALTVGAVAVSIFCPAFSSVAMGIGLSKNAIDLYNIATNNQKDNLGQWGKELATDVAVRLAYLGASNLAGSLAWKATEGTIAGTRAAFGTNSKALEILMNPYIQNGVKLGYEIGIETAMNIPMTYLIRGDVDGFGELMENVFYDSLPYVRMGILKNSLNGLETIDENGAKYKMDSNGNRYYLNSDNNVTQIKDANGTTRVVYNYDESGKVKSVTQYLEDGVTKVKETKIISDTESEVTHYGKDGSKKLTEKITEDSKGNVQKIEYTDSTGKAIETDIYDNGVLKSIQKTEEINGETYNTETNYDLSGKATSKSYLNEAGQVQKTVNYRYEGDSTKPSGAEITEYNNGSVVKYNAEYEYDPATGKTSKVTTTDENGVKEVKTYKYNPENGELIEVNGKSIKTVDDSYTKVTENFGWESADRNYGKYEGTCALDALFEQASEMPILQQAIENNVTYNPETDTYEFYAFGELNTVKLQPGESIIDKYYDAYAMYFIKSGITDESGDYFTKVYEDIIGDASNVIVKPSAENIEDIRTCLHTGSSMLTFNTKTATDKLIADHAYVLQDVAENGDLILKDPSSGEIITLKSGEYEDLDCQIAGKTYMNESMLDGIDENKVAQTLGIANKSAIYSDYKPVQDNASLNKYRIDKSKYGKKSHAEFCRTNDILKSADGKRPAWFDFHPKSQKHGAWKMHIFADNEAEWQMLVDAIGPYLKDMGVDWKTFSENIDPKTFGTSGGGEQHGKAFTIYPESIEQFEKIARDLDYIIRNNGLCKSGTNTIGDHQLGTTGRLFYRFELKSGNLVDSQGRTAKDPRFSLDLSNKTDSDNFFGPRMADGSRNTKKGWYDHNKERQAGYNENPRKDGLNHLPKDMTAADDPWLNFDPANPTSKPSFKNNSSNEKKPTGNNNTVLGLLQKSVYAPKGEYRKIDSNSYVLMPDGSKTNLNCPEINNLKPGEKISLDCNGCKLVFTKDSNGNLWVKDVNIEGQVYAKIFFNVQLKSGDTLPPNQTTKVKPNSTLILSNGKRIELNSPSIKNLKPGKSLNIENECTIFKDRYGNIYVKNGSSAGTKISD